MRVELLREMTNVVRFPVERRAWPTLGLLRDIAPDVREVLAIAESFQIEAPVPDLRDEVDAATAEYIANQVPAGGPERAAMLRSLLEPTVLAAVSACRVARDASLEAAAAQQALLKAQTKGGLWLAPLWEQAEALTGHAARLLLIAHAHTEEAEGVARAVGMTRRGDVWMPRDVRADADALFGLLSAG